MFKKLVFFLALISLLFYSCKRNDNVYTLIKENKEKTAQTDFKKWSLDELYFDLLNQISFAEPDSLLSKKLDFYEKSAKNQKDTLHIYRSNYLFITANPTIDLSDNRFSLVLKSIEYFNDNNLKYDAFYTNYITAEYYLGLQYYKLAENYIFNTLENLEYNDHEYAYEKSLASMTASNILFKQKKITECYDMVITYERYNKYFDEQLYSQERIKLLKSLYYNNMAVIGNLVGKIDSKQGIDYFHKSFKLLENQDNYIHKSNTAFNIFKYKVKNNDADSIEFYLNEFEKIKTNINTSPQIQLKFAEVPTYYLKIKKDTLAAKKIQKDLLKENQTIYKNIYLEKKIYEQLITETDSFSNNLYRNYLNVLDSIEKESDDKFKTNQKIAFKSRELIYENNKLKQETYLVVGLIIGISIIIFFTILNIIQKSNLKKLQLRNDYLEQDAKAFEITLDYKNNIEEKLSNNKKLMFMELHDNIVNKLFGVRFLVHKDFIKSDSLQKAQTAIEEVKNSLIEICDNYDNINNLFEKESFEKMLSELIASQPNHLISFTYNFDKTIDWSKLNPRIRFNLYRIIQELLQNIHKHSLATRADVTIIKKASIIELVISDNGKGYTKNTKNGIGLTNINERINEIKAHLEVHSTKGTQVIISLHV